MDAEIINNKNGKSTRIIYKEIFDFGTFSFPRRVGGTDEVLKPETWTEEERKVSNWIHEFGCFSKTIRQ